MGFYYDSGDPEAMQTMMNAYQNDTAASYLSVVGVVYSLVVAHMLTITNTKQETSNELLSGEIAEVRTIVLMLKTIRTTDTIMLKEKVGAVKMVMAYLNLLNLNWGACDTESADKATDVLYGVLPYVKRICSMHHNEFYTNLGDRIIDTTNDVATANAKRFSIQAYSLPTMLWVLHFVISTSMFFGVALIYTGAHAFNFLLCGSAATLMGVSAYAIADLDDPFEGNIQLHKTSLLALISYVEGVLADENRLKEDIAEQSNSTRQGIDLLMQRQKKNLGFKTAAKLTRVLFGRRRTENRGHSTQQIVLKQKSNNAEP